MKTDWNGAGSGAGSSSCISIGGGGTHAGAGGGGNKEHGDRGVSGVCGVPDPAVMSGSGPPSA